MAEQPQTDHAALVLRGPVLMGFGIVILFFGVFLGWAATAPLESAAIAPGIVSVDTNRKTVKHLEGGIVKEILVREGDAVGAGQVIIRLDDTQAKARMDLLRGQIASTKIQLKLISGETDDVAKLFKRGLTPKSRLLALRRRKAELEGELIEHESQLQAAAYVLARTDITAPLDGTVVGLQAHTVGGVVGAGEILLDIVPRDEALVIEARVNPLDIDVVAPGLKASVRLTPYNQRDLPPAAATVISVSADRITDERTGVDYYLTRVVLTEEMAGRFQEVSLYPGMPAEVMILTGKRTVLDFLIDPILKSFNRAFRES